MITRLKPFTLAAIFAASLLVIPLFAQAQNGTTPSAQIPKFEQSIFDQLNEQELVEMTLIANLDSLINVRKSNDFTKAQLTYKDQWGEEHTYKVKYRTRGRFRRRVCDVPPLKLKFSKKQLKANQLNEHNDLKLVTHCLEDENFTDKLVLKEYLAYQLFQELSPHSFRTQLVRITYQDKNDPHYLMTKYGFLIEDTDEMAERIGGQECEECFGLADEKYHASSERIAALFQVMIGNADWSTQMNRNVKQILLPDEKVVAVPYDFDFSVLVGAPYLRPNVDHKQSTNMERIFLGKSKNMRQMSSTISYFKTKQGKLIDIILDFDLLEKKEKQQMVAYLKSFFEQIENKQTAAEMLFERSAVPLR